MICNCENCKKKLKLIFFTCECGGNFCEKHRFKHSHNCSYINNKKIILKKEIENNNPIIIPKKLDII